MRRREFITLLGGGAASAWPSSTHAQRRTARVGALMSFTEANPESKGLVAAIEKQLGAAGWHKDSNLAIDYRWNASDPERFSRDAEELVRAAPDVLLAFGTPALIPLRKSAATIPIVFAAVSDPVGQGFVTNLAHPGGTVTGFSNYDPDIGSKWLPAVQGHRPIGDERHSDVQSEHVAVQRLVDALNRSVSSWTRHCYDAGVGSKRRRHPQNYRSLEDEVRQRSHRAVQFIHLRPFGNDCIPCRKQPNTRDLCLSPLCS